MLKQNSFLRGPGKVVHKARTGKAKLLKTIYTALCIIAATALAIGSEQFYLMMTGGASVYAAVSSHVLPDEEGTAVKAELNTDYAVRTEPGIMAVYALRTKEEAQAELDKIEQLEILAQKAKDTNRRLEQTKKEIAAEAAAAKAAAKAAAEAERFKPLAKEKVSGRSLSRRKEIVLSAEERRSLERIVEAESGGEDIVGRILVANVVLNRYRSDVFPDTIEGVVTQRNNSTYQFSPARPGCGYWTAKPSKTTKEAVDRALAGEDYSEGALYFAARKYADKSNMSWFDRKLTRLFKHGNHEFYF